MAQGPWGHHRRSGIADDIDFEIKGEELQFVEIELDPDESAITTSKRARVHQYPDGHLATFHGPRCLARYTRDAILIEEPTNANRPPKSAGRFMGN